MRADLTYTYLLSASTTLITSYVANYRFRRGSKECNHLVEFMAAMLFMTSVSYLVWDKGPLILGLSMLSWIWTLKTLIQISQDLSGKPLFQKDHYFALFVGFLFSLLLIVFGYESLVFTAPFSVGFSLVGISVVFQSLIKSPRSKRPKRPLFLLFFFLMTALLASRAIFPIWINYNETKQFGVLFDCFILILFNATLIPLYFETFTISGFERALDVRNQQLFNRSSFSEFKILSAGIAHEINNALTIINAKTEQLMRIYKGEEDQNGFRLILHSADRIGKVSVD